MPALPGEGRRDDQYHHSGDRARVPEGLEVGLRNYWYPILQTEELPNDQPVGMTVLGEEITIWRDGRGEPKIVAGRCPHRHAKLSVGRILDGQLQCAFHGLRFDGQGRCVLIPWGAGS